MPFLLGIWAQYSLGLVARLPHAEQVEYSQSTPIEVRLTRPVRTALANLGKTCASISCSSSTQVSGEPSGLRSRCIAAATMTPRARRWFEL